MKRFLLVVLDGFGIGAMDDVSAIRPDDIGANTALHIYNTLPNFKLPTLASLGLGNAMLASEPSTPLPAALSPAKSCCYGFHNLAHFGADTFWGHQEFMGTKPKKGETGPILPKLPEIRSALEAKGHKVRFYSGDAGGAEREMLQPGILIVDECVTVGDNLETDLGNNYNVTAALDLLPFEEVRKIGKIVRSLVKTSRVIVFGGHGLGLNELLSAYECKTDYAGVNAPRSGVYRQGYEVIHLGYGVNTEVQLPAVLARAGIPTVLIGKAADIIENPCLSMGEALQGKSISGVDTGEVLSETIHALNSLEHGFICVNVQETDLAGHREDTRLYGEVLSLADSRIKDIIEKLGTDDVMVISGDHGNDPTIGHSRHTREKTPILVWSGKAAAKNSVFLGGRASLADTGATAAAFFDALPPESGLSYLGNI